MVSQIAISGQDPSKVSLWCFNLGVDQYGNQKFEVINGRWFGYITLDGRIYANITPKYDPDHIDLVGHGKIVWRGKNPIF